MRDTDNLLDHKRSERPKYVYELLGYSVDNPSDRSNNIRSHQVIMSFFNPYQNAKNKFGIAPKLARTLDGLTFDSKKEMERYAELKLLEKAGLITHVKRQEKFVLQPAFTKGVRKFRAIEYKADFTYFDKSRKKIIVEDVKGVETKEFSIKRKLFEYVYPNLTLEVL